MEVSKLDVNYSFPKNNFKVPDKLLAGAGPTNVSSRVLSALLQKPLTPVCAEMYQMMDDIKALLKYVFQTKNEVTLALQNSGTGGLEAALANLADPGEKIIVAVGGVWGDRMIEKAKIRNLDVVRLVSKPGEVFGFDELEKEIIKHKPVALLMTHGETSVGTLQPLDGLGDICHKHNCLLVVDAVASLGGAPFFTDRWGVDVVVSAGQKAIGAPPGLSFLTFSPKAVERVKCLRTPPPFYYNLLKLCDVWNCFGAPRRYYYTYNSHMIACAREALMELAEEGLQNVWARHARIASRFLKGLEELGLSHFVANPEHRLCTVTVFSIPEGVKWGDLVHYFVEKHQVMISFGIGPTLNKAIRIGTMGINAKEEVVDRLLKILDEGIRYLRSGEGKNGYAEITEVL